MEVFDNLINSKIYDLPFFIDELKINIDKNIKTMELLKKCEII